MSDTSTPTIEATPLQSEAMAYIMSLLRARIPIIYVVTHEERRFIEELDQQVKKAFKDTPRKTWVWSSCQGLVANWLPLQLTKTTEEKSENPRVALEKIISHPVMKNQPGDVYILRDFHKNMGENIPRMLRDMYEVLIHHKKTIIITAPSLSHGVNGRDRGLEPTLEKQVVVVNYNLPSREMLFQEIKSTVNSVLARTPALTCTFTDEQFSEFARACQGLTINEAINSITTCLVQLRTIDTKRLLQEKKNIIRKSDVLEYIETSITTADVGGMDEAKKYFRAYKNSWSDEARAYGVNPLKGVLLVGVPGCGKSLLAKGVAEEYNLPILRLDVGRVMAGLVGQSESRMREAIQMAEAVAPCVLWLDEVEKALSGTGSSNFSDGGTLSRVFGTLLTAMQEGMNGVVIVATANDIKKLPPEFIRRFNETLFVDLPTEDERAEIFTIHLRKKGRDPEKFNLPKLVEASDDFTGAEIEKAIGDSLAMAWQEGREVTAADILFSIKNTKPISRVMSDKIKELRADAKGRFRYASSQAAKRAGQTFLHTATGKKMEVDLDSMMDDISIPSKDTPGNERDIDIGDT